MGSRWNVLAACVSIGAVAFLTSCDGKAEGCRGDAQCGAGGRCVAGQCTSPLTVRLLAPAPGLATNSAAPLEVAVQVLGGEAEAVTLWMDDVPLASFAGAGGEVLVHPWDTATAPEGAHLLWARATAGGRRYDSPSIPITVDRTPPHIVSRTPMPCASGVWSRADVVVVFDEPILEASVSSRSVRLRAERGGELFFASRLAGDTLTLSPPSPLPLVPNTLTAALTGLTDPAGNRLPDAVWSWDLPEWVDLAAPTLLTGTTPIACWAMTPDHRGVVAWRDYPYPTGARVLRSDGATFTELAPGGLEREARSMHGVFSSAVDSQGRIVVAYTETTQGRRLYVDRLEGAQWVPLGGSLTTSDADLPSIVVVRLDGQDRPYVLWKGIGADGQDELFLRRWTGGAWDDVSIWTAGSGPVTALDLAVAPDGRVSAATVSGGGVWLVGGGMGMAGPFGSGTASEVSLAVDELGRTVVAWVEGGAAWTAVPTSDWNWTYVGGPLGRAAGGLVLAVRPEAPVGERLALAFVDAGRFEEGRKQDAGPRAYLFDGVRWVEISSTIGSTAWPAYAVGSGLRAAGDVLSFAWYEDRTSVHEVRTLVSKLYNR